MRRPLAVAGLSLMFSIILASCLSLNISICIGAVAVLFAAVILCIKSVPKTLPACLLFCAAGMFVYSLTVSLIQLPLENSYGGKECIIQGVVEGDGEKSYDNIRYKIKVTSVDGKEEDFYIRLTTDNIKEIDSYSVISFKTVLKIPENLPGLQFNNRSNLLSQGYRFTSYCKTESITVTGQMKTPWYEVFSDIRKVLIGSLKDTLGEDSGVAIAIALGDTSVLTEEQNDAYRKTGVYHLFSVSGLHLSVILSAYLWLSRKLRINRQISYLIGILLILAFMAITGFPLSVIRAGIMGILTLIALMIFREADPFNSLGAAITVVVLINPFSALDMGFQMSVCATLGLILIYPRMMPTLFVPKEEKEKNENSEEDEEEKKPTVIDRLKQISKRAVIFTVASLITSVSANIFLLPIYSYSFGSISLLMPVANLLLVPIGSGILVLSLTAGVLNLIPVIGTYLAFVFAFADRLIIKCSDLVCLGLGNLEIGQIEIANTCAQITVVFIIIAVLMWINKRITKVSGLMASLCCVAVILCGTVSDYFLCKDLTKVYFWGNDYSSCAVINSGGYSLTYAPDGFYGEAVAGRYRCIDGCFTYQEVSFEQKVTVDEINGWDVELISSEKVYPALIISNGETDILFVNCPNEELTQKILDKNITFNTVYFADGYESVTRLITESRIADTVVYLQGNGAFPETKGKLYALSYNVIDITNTDGMSITLSADGKYKIN